MYKIYTKTSEDSGWDAIIDVKNSTTKIVHRVFMNQEEVDAFVRVALKDKPEDFIKVEQVEDE
jgi:hypothetical protein